MNSFFFAPHKRGILYKKIGQVPLPNLVPFGSLALEHHEFHPQ